MVCSMAPRMTIPMTRLRAAPSAMRMPISGRAADDGVSRDAVKTDGGEQQRQQAEEGSEARDEALLDESIVNLLLECLEFYDGEVRVDAGQGVATIFSKPGTGRLVWITSAPANMDRSFSSELAGVGVVGVAGALG